MDEYIIINKKAIQKRIEELEKELKTLGDTYEEEIHAHGYISGKVNQLKQILSQSTPLIPEIEKAIDAPKKYPWSGNVKKDYISNLKLDI